MTSDFLNAPYPPPLALSDNLSSSKRYFNREMSWLKFNDRVLEEATSSLVPLLERLRFLSISAQNLDEFFTVRVAGLRELSESSNAPLSLDGQTAREQLDKIEAHTRDLMTHQQDVFKSLRLEMETQELSILTASELSVEDQDWLEAVFLSEVFPVLSPLAIDPAHPFPFIPNAGFSLALELKRTRDGRPLRALLPIPAQIKRFMALPPQDDRPMAHRFLPLEELLLLNIERLFPGYSLNGSCVFSVLRDSDLEVEEEAEDLVRGFETALKRRRRGRAVHLKISAQAPLSLKSMIMKELSVGVSQTFEIDGLIGVSDLQELVIKERPDLLWPSIQPRVPERLQDHEDDLFAAIRHKDILLHHPYESFDIVCQFLQQAAGDPDVVAIKQTLYRTSHNSPIVEALCQAAEAGKSVTALVELKARFDEAANIRQSRRLERAGAHVVYGFLSYKTHAKISTIVRREGTSLVTYTHFGTGNYHPITARIYTDVSLFTCNASLGRDATKVFNYLSGYAQPENLENLAISPLDLKETLLKNIRHEIAFAQAGKPAHIWAKMNALIDKDIIDALYEASQAGVQISLIVRGICGLRPGIVGLSDNIRVKSIVGRFLEHARLICFGNGTPLPHPNALVYMSSADWMGRNFERRVETLIEVTNPTVKSQMTEQIMAANLHDTAQSWVLDGHGDYHRTHQDAGQPAFNCHQFFLNNPSLSGRGTAGHADVLSIPQAPTTLQETTK